MVTGPIYIGKRSLQLLCRLVEGEGGGKAQFGGEGAEVRDDEDLNLCRRVRLICSFIHYILNIYCVLTLS